MLSRRESLEDGSGLEIDGVDLRGVLSNPPETLKDLLGRPAPESHEP
jgi:hypothetical protein